MMNAALVQPAFPEGVEDVAFDQEVFEGPWLGRLGGAAGCGADGVRGREGTRPAPTPA